MLTQLGLSQPQTTKRKMEVPTDRLLRDGGCSAKYHSSDNTDCSCNGDFLPFEEQTLSSIFGTEGITVSIPSILLYNLDAQAICDTICAKLHAEYRVTDIFVCEAWNGDRVNVEFTKSYAESIFPSPLAREKNVLTSEIIGHVTTGLSEIKVARMMQSSDFFDHAVSLVRG